MLSNFSHIIHNTELGYCLINYSKSLQKSRPFHAQNNGDLKLLLLMLSALARLFKRAFSAKLTLLKL